MAENNLFANGLNYIITLRCTNQLLAYYKECLKSTLQFIPLISLLTAVEDNHLRNIITILTEFPISGLNIRALWFRTSCL